MTNDQLIRFMSHVQIDSKGCWIWTGALSSSGKFPVVKRSGNKVRAKRVSYVHFVGPVPAGQVTRTVCGEALCVNPSHLKTVDKRSLFGTGPHEVCKNGHPLVDDNIMTYGNRRRCRACSNAWRQAYKAKVRGTNS